MINYICDLYVIHCTDTAGRRTQVWASSGSKLWYGSTMEECTGRSGSFTKLCSRRLMLVPPPVLVINAVPPLLVW